MATDAAVRLADAWWDSLDGARRAQIHRWIAGGEAHLDHYPLLEGQTDLLSELDRSRP